MNHLSKIIYESEKENIKIIKSLENKSNQKRLEEIIENMKKEYIDILKFN